MEEPSTGTPLGISKVDVPVGAIVVLNKRNGWRVCGRSTTNKFLGRLDGLGAGPLGVVVEEHLGFDDGRSGKGPAASAF